MNLSKVITHKRMATAFTALAAQLLLALSNIQAGPITADRMFVKQLLSTGLPLVSITTVSGNDPTYEETSPPVGAWGLGITNASKEPSRVIIQIEENTVYDSGDYEKDVAGATLKIHGNTSAYTAKKAYKIKLQKGADLLCRDDKRFKDKEWLLLKVININGLIGFKMNEIIGLQWAPSCQLVNVVINTDYKGMYLLAESVKRNSDCRLDVDKNEGYIFEWDPYWWNESLYVESSYADPLNYTLKYPDASDITEEQLQWFTSFIETFEQSIDNGTYPEVIDVQSFANWMLGRDILGNSDAAGSNIYFTKYDHSPEAKIVMGPMWDFDGIMKNDDFDHIHLLGPFLSLIRSEDHTFWQTYLATWLERRDQIFEELDAFLDALPETRDGKGYETSFALNSQRWDYWVEESIETAVSNAKAYFKHRKEVLNSLLIGEGAIMVGFKNMPICQPMPTISSRVYSLTGQALDKHSNLKGIIFNDKKKVIVK